MSTTSVPQAGDPCPNGCVIHDRTGTGWVPERLAESLPGSGDGELTCHSCWDSWNTIRPRDQEKSVMTGTRKQRADIAYAIIMQGAANALSLFGEQPECGYYDGIASLDYSLVAAITADLLKNMPGDLWDSRIPVPADETRRP